MAEIKAQWLEVFNEYRKPLELARDEGGEAIYTTAQVLEAAARMTEAEMSQHLLDGHLSETLLKILEPSLRDMQDLKAQLEAAYPPVGKSEEE